MRFTASTRDGVGHLHRGALGRHVCRARARLRRGRLDADHAGGADPGSTPELMLRAERLGSVSHRRVIAAGVEGLVMTAGKQRLACRSRVPIRPGVVLEHRDALLAVAARLRQLEPVEIAAIAELERLLRADSGSPVYVGGRPPQDMDAAITRILRVLY